MANERIVAKQLSSNVAAANGAAAASDAAARAAGAHADAPSGASDGLGADGSVATLALPDASADGSADAS
ncbi:MAG: hypothetical protein UFX72_08570, partial [Adlercreutzia sp.]|nr:hypothetical protein [Adlercreutzia sp.]